MVSPQRSKIIDPRKLRQTDVKIQRSGSGRDPEERYQHANDVRAALEALQVAATPLSLTRWFLAAGVAARFWQWRLPTAAATPTSGAQRSARGGVTDLLQPCQQPPPLSLADFQFLGCLPLRNLSLLRFL